MLNSDEISEFIGNKPTLREYGLTKRLVREIEQPEAERSERRHQMSWRLFKLIWFGGWIGIAAYDYAVNQSASGIVNGLFLAGLFAFVFVISSGASDEVERRLNPPHPQLSDWNRFLEAEAAHHEALQITSGEFWEALSGWEFEQEFAKVLEGLNYNVTRKGGSGDEGIDLIALKGRQRVAVQCKAHKRPVGPAIAREFYGSMVHGGFRRGILAYPSGFSQGTEDFVQGKKISLYGLDELVEAHVRSLS